MLAEYSLQDTVLSIDGQRIEGFGPDDVISFKEPIDLAEVQYTADGHPVVSGNRCRTLECEITVTQNTPGFKTLFDLSQTQFFNAFAKFTFNWQELGASGDIVRCGNAKFLTRPANTYGRVAGQQVYSMVLPDVQETQMRAPLL